MSNCQWTHMHSGENRVAQNRVTLPGLPDGGVEWFDGPEPPIRLELCTPCTGVFKAQNPTAEIERLSPHSQIEAPLPRQARA